VAVAEIQGWLWGTPGTCGRGSKEVGRKHDNKIFLVGDDTWPWRIAITRAYCSKWPEHVSSSLRIEVCWWPEQLKSRESVCEQEREYLKGRKKILKPPERERVILNHASEGK
jgi:hypothetical protein